MSKPKPGLGKGIVRTLAHAHPHPTTSTSVPLQLAPVVSHYSTYSSGSSTQAESVRDGWRRWDTSISLLPSWEGDFGRLSISDPMPVVFNRSLLRPTLKAPKPLQRQYTTASAPARAAVETAHAFNFHSPFGPSSFLQFDKSYYGYVPKDHLPLNDFFNAPPPSPPPAPARFSPQPMKPPRPSEPHTVLAPAAVTPTNSTSPTVSLTSHPYLAFPNLDQQSAIASPDSNDSTSLGLYSSSLIFHLGASGWAKERLPSPPPRENYPSPPPRPRSFPLPQVSTPTYLHSTAVGEDAYFTRSDGMCIADGVGGWARSGRGGADAARWSRLLTHFCETEVAEWWAGAERYIVDLEEERETSPDEDLHWSRRTWRMGGEESGNDSRGLEKGKRRRPLDPVEIMQRGYEKCLACVTAEGINGSSTCLLALLHHSTLHIANLGDCALLLIRGGQIVFRTSEMQHAFNFPLQVGTHSRDEPMKDAKKYEVGVERADVVVLGSDGLLDNLFDEDILEVLASFAPPSNTSNTNTQQPTPPSSRPTSPSNLPPFSPQKVSEALCNRARDVSEHTNATTPFMVRAIEEGIDFVGGKKDDISVLVGVVGGREDQVPHLSLRT